MDARKCILKDMIITIKDDKIIEISHGSDNRR
jgi:hypothetical protein